MVNKPYGTKTGKLIDLRHHSVRQKLVEGNKTVFHVPASGQKADIFTKPLKCIAFDKKCDLLNMEYEPSDPGERT